MIFLIDYDRPKGSLVSINSFNDDQSSDAVDQRLKLELELRHKGLDREVVILDAPNEQALRRTHQRYFYTAREIADR